MSLRSEKLMTSAALLVILAGGFFALAPWTTARATTPPSWMVTSMDDLIPLVPSFVWIYLSWYPATFLVLFADRSTFRRVASAYALAFGACVVGYVVWPVTIVRPALDGGAGLSRATLATLYTLDPPVHLFPSFHAAIATIVWQSVRPRGLTSSFVGVWAIAIGAACLLTKQHYLLDVITGGAVGWFSSVATDVFSASSRARSHHELSPSRHG